jgi:hypothetical protein
MGKQQSMCQAQVTASREGSRELASTSQRSGLRILSDPRLDGRADDPVLQRLHPTTNDVSMIHGRMNKHH